MVQPMCDYIHFAVDEIRERPHVVVHTAQAEEEVPDRPV
jgi:hypothetical protein